MSEPVEAQEEEFANEETAVSVEEKLEDDVEDVRDSGVGEKRWPGWPGESVFRILIPARKVGGMIGRKGELIRKMCEESRARIKILDGPPSASERAVMFSDFRILYKNHQCEPKIGGEKSDCREQFEH